MKKKMLLHGSRIAAFATAMFTSATLFAGLPAQDAQIAAAAAGGNLIQPVTDNVGGDLIHIDDAERDWVNTGGTDFNTAANWVQNAVPGSGDVAYFNAAEVSQPNLSASLTIAGLMFSAATSNGYDLTATAGAVLTLNGTNTSGSGGTSTSSAAAIRNNATSGTNTIDAPLILASSSGVSTFFNASTATTILNGTIGESAAGKSLSLKAGTFELNGSNTFTGGVSIDTGAIVTLGNNNALGTGTFNISSTSVIQAGGGPRTLANAVVFGGSTTIAGGNAFTFNGAASSSGANTRTVTISNTGGATFNGTTTVNGASGVGTLVFNGTSAVILNGVVQDGAFGTSGLRYAGTGTMTLNAVNTYTGETQGTVAGGSIIVGASGTLGAGNVRLTAGNVTLTLSGPTQIASSASLFYVATDTINLNYNGTDTIAGLTVDGVAQAPGVYGAGFNNPDSAFFGVGTITVVPEPTTWGMLILGGGLLTAVRRFRRKQI